jgi:hypothetical protein
MSCLILILALRLLDLPRRFVPLPAGLIVARRVANQPVAQVGSRWFHRLHQLSARKKGILQQEARQLKYVKTIAELQVSACLGAN